MIVEQIVSWTKGDDDIMDQSERWGAWTAGYNKEENI